MEFENKKIAYYVVGAVVLGSVAFFVSSFFKKGDAEKTSTEPTEVNSSTPPEPNIEEDSKPTTNYGQFFSDLSNKNVGMEPLNLSIFGKRK